MGFFFVDESIHSNQSLAVVAFVYCDTDPSERIRQLLEVAGATEHKSSTLMNGNPIAKSARRIVSEAIFNEGLVGAAVFGTTERRRFGPFLLEVLYKLVHVHGLFDTFHSVHFDQGLLPGTRTAMDAYRSLGLNACCDLFFEQDSRQVAGIQMADLAAHMLASIILEGMGVITKNVKAGPYSGYDPDLEMNLGFELWATLRYKLFGSPCVFHEEEGCAVGPLTRLIDYGIFLDESCSADHRRAAKQKFRTNWLGCIH